MNLDALMLFNTFLVVKHLRLENQLVKFLAGTTNLHWKNLFSLASLQSLTNSLDAGITHGSSYYFKPLNSFLLRDGLLLHSSYST